MGFPVTCSVCGRSVSDDLDSSSRAPCTNCGSTLRTVHAEARIEARATVTAIASVTLGELKAVVTASSLVMQTVVVTGERSSEGQLIKAVAVPWFEIVKLLQADPAAAFQIPPRKWEEIIAGAYKQAGFDEVTLTPSSRDFGRDVIAIKRGLGSIRVIDQVKAYKPDHLVTANDVRALMGVLPTDTASKGFLTTTSDFAPRLREDPLISPYIPSRLELIDGRMLLERLQNLAGLTSTSS